jgi:tRNA1(Val) A37 N6-methylase TrmN6
MVHAHCVDALKFMNETSDKYDMILAGPPYYNIENYNGVEQKGTYNEWLENFVKPFCDFSSRVLNNKGVLALHIYDTHKYAFIESFMFFLNKFGLSHVKQFKFGFLKKTGRSQFVHIFSKTR